MKTVEVEVLQMDIDMGKRFSNMSCPIALAARRSFPGEPISVGTLNIVVGSSSIQLPNNAKTFVRDFDDDKEVRPFKFFVNLAS